MRLASTETVLRDDQWIPAVDSVAAAEVCLAASVTVAGCRTAKDMCQPCHQVTFDSDGGLGESASKSDK